MAMKKGSSNAAKKNSGGTTRTANPATPANTAKPAANATAGDEVKKAGRPRKPPVVRAIKLATQLAKKAIALEKQTERWKGDGTEEQKLSLSRVRENLNQIGTPIADLQDDLDFLQESGWVPASSGLGRKPIAVGDNVRIREKFYESDIQGGLNEFNVVKLTEKNAVIEPVDKSMKPFPVPRHYLARLASAATEDGGADDVDGNDAMGDLVTDVA